jgi:hypothetical protein
MKHFWPRPTDDEFIFMIPLIVWGTTLGLAGFIVLMGELLEAVLR